MLCEEVDFSCGRVELMEPGARIGDADCGMARLVAPELCDLTVSPRVRYRVTLEELSDEEAANE